MCRRALGGAEAMGEWLLNTSTSAARTYQWRINSCQIPRRAERVSPMSQQQLQKITSLSLNWNDLIIYGGETHWES
jgi:hypothetical protein